MKPSYYAMEMVSLRSFELGELSALDVQHGGEVTPLELGDRVYMSTIDGDFAGTVIEEWVPGLNALVHIDHHGPVSFHRSVFRTWSVLDHLASSQAGAVLT
jgi:hypothetical protein